MTTCSRAEYMRAYRAAHPAYVAADARSKRVKRAVNPTYTRIDKRKRINNRVLEIVAWDGEGTEAPDGVPQPYVLLMNSLGGEWYDRNGLGTLAIFKALIQTAYQRKHALHFIYGGSYDVNQWLKDAPEAVLRTLWKTGKVSWAGYYIEYRPRKMFRLKHQADGISITIWDAYSWCQRAFVSALEEYLSKDYDDLALIKAGKARRSTFAESEREYIATYTRAELRALVSLVLILIQRLHDAGIYVSRWDGPGAAAAALLRDKRIAQWKGETPIAMREAAAVAYSGGRIELLKYGNHDGAVYHYDIHSAYPAAMVRLPALAHGRWEYQRDNRGAIVPDREHALYHITWQSDAGARPFYPFPYRTDDGSIYYPPRGESWVWGPEMLAYREHAQAFDITVRCYESYTFHEAVAGFRPFAWVEQLYNLRQQWKREGNAAEWALKLGLNSLYGKLAQTVGWSESRRPPYYQLEWAGLITSYTRAQLLRAAMHDPQACIMFATDGVFSTSPLPLSIGVKLGEWGEEQHDGLTAVQSGVYFVRDNSEWLTWSRGYNADELQRGHIMQAWQNGIDKIQIPQTRFLTLGSALASPKGVSESWRSWQTGPRDLQLRATGKRLDPEARANPARGLVASVPAYALGESLQQRSAPYNRAWREGVTEVLHGVPLEVYETEVSEAAI